MIDVFFLYALCGLSFTVSKSALFYGTPLFFVALRMILAGALLAIPVFYFKQAGRLNYKDLGLFIKAALFHIYFAYIADAWALQYMSSCESAFLYDFSPFITAIGSYFVFKERMTGVKFLGMSVGFLALLWVLTCKEGILASYNIFVTLSMLAAVISSAYGWIIVRQLIQRNYTVLFINSISMFFGGLLALFTSFFAENWTAGFPIYSWQPFLFYLALTILLINGAFYNFYGYLLKKYTATFLSFAGFTCPFFVQLFGTLFLGEQISIKLIIATVIVSISLYIFYKEELRQGYIHG